MNTPCACASSICKNLLQIMLASILVVVGLWWLVRTVLALFINLVCPLLVVLLAVVSTLFYLQDVCCGGAYLLGCVC